MTPEELSNAALIQAIASRAETVSAAANTLVGQLAAIGPLVAEAAKRLAAVPLPSIPPPETQPETPTPTVPAEPIDLPLQETVAPIKVPSAPGLAPFVIENKIINMGNHTSGIEMASPDFWPPKGPKTDADGNRELTVRNVVIWGDSPASGKDWGINVFACKALTLNRVSVYNMKKEHGAYMHNPAGPTVLRDCRFEDNGGQGVQETRRPHMPPGLTNYEGPYIVPDHEDTFLAVGCLFSGNGLDPSRAAWAGGFYAARHTMFFEGCTFVALADAPNVALDAKAGALCVAPEEFNPSAPATPGLVHGEPYPGARHRTALTLDRCHIAARTDIPRPAALFGSLRYLHADGCSFAGTRVMIEDPAPGGTFSFTGCSGHVPIFASMGFGKPSLQIGWTDEGFNMTGAEILAKLPPVSIV